MKLYYILILLIVIAIIYLFYRLDQADLLSGRFSTEDFDVIESYSDSGDAIKLMERINIRIMHLLRHLKKKYCINVATSSCKINNTSDVGREIAARILKNYNFEKIFENDPKTSKDTSYTIDKGEKMYFCIRNKKDHKLIDDDTVLFVALHEISHIGNSTWGHDRSFWRTFKFVLKEAEAAGIYTPVDYARRPITYCGLFVDYNPYFDGSL